MLVAGRCIGAPVGGFSIGLLGGDARRRCFFAEPFPWSRRKARGESAPRRAPAVARKPMRNAKTPQPAGNQATATYARAGVGEGIMLHVRTATHDDIPGLTELLLISLHAFDP